MLSVVKQDIMQCKVASFVLILNELKKVNKESTTKFIETKVRMFSASSRIQTACSVLVAARAIGSEGGGNVAAE